MELVRLDTTCIAALRCARLPGTGNILVCLLLLAIFLQGGCGKNEFEFVTTDERGRPLEGVEVFYYREADFDREEVVVGRTDANGSLAVSGAHLNKQYKYHFRKDCMISSPTERFDPNRCAVVTGGGPGHYSFSASDGRLRSSDLKRKRRMVKMTCVPREIDSEWGAGGADGSGRQQPLTRFLDMRTEPGAVVSINGRILGEVLHSGELRTPFCPGDSADCFGATVTITVEKPGFETVTQTMGLPEPQDTLICSPQLEPTPQVHDEDPEPDVTEDPPRPPQPRSVQVRIENRGLPQSCGPVGLDWPHLLVNNLRTRVHSAPASTGLRAYYDLLLMPNTAYCIAMECPEGGQSPESWNPWDARSGQPVWYRIEIPAGVRRAYFAVPSHSPGRSLQLDPEISGSWDRFDDSQATKITHECAVE